jgi:hypothetical protein
MSSFLCLAQILSYSTLVPGFGHFMTNWEFWTLQSIGHWTFRFVSFGALTHPFKYLPN